MAFRQLALLALAMWQTSSATFNISEIRALPEVAKIGQNVKLLCQVEGREWEYCYWSHERNGGCEWEWKQAYGDVRMQNDNCTRDLKERASFLGNGYIDNDKNKEMVLCNIMLSNVTVEDEGIWSCSMESYVLGQHTSGYKATRSFNLKIEEPTTTTTQPITTSTTNPRTTLTTQPRSNDSPSHSSAIDFPISVGVFIILMNM